MKRRAVPVLLLALLPLAGAGGGTPGWWAIRPGGELLPSSGPVPARPCPPLRLPASWDVRFSVFADVTGDGLPECILSVWRPWRDWPIARWNAAPTRIGGNRDARGFSSHVAVLAPLGGGAYRNVWVGSALFRPVTALTVLPSGRLVTLETTYPRGRSALSVALSEWTWTGFGFRLVRRVPVQARDIQVGVDGLPVVR